MVAKIQHRKPQAGHPRSHGRPSHCVGFFACRARFALRTAEEQDCYSCKRESRDAHNSKPMWLPNALPCELPRVH